MEAIEWERSFEDSRGARIFRGVFVGSLLGFLLLAATAVAITLPFMVGSLLANPAALALAALFALVGGPMSLFSLWPLLTDPEQREGLGLFTGIRALPSWHVVAAAVIGALAHVVAFRVFELGPVPVFVVGVLVGGLGMSRFLSAGRIDPDERTLTVRPNHWDDRSATRTVDLDGWTNLR